MDENNIFIVLYMVPIRIAVLGKYLVVTTINNDKIDYNIIICL